MVSDRLATMLQRNWTPSGANRSLRRS